MAKPAFQPSALSYGQISSSPWSELAAQVGAGSHSPRGPIGRHALQLPVDTEPKKPKAALMLGGIALVALLPFIVGPWAVKQFKPEWSYGKRLVTSFMVSTGIAIARKATREPSPDQPPLREMWSGSLTEEGVGLGNPGFLPEVAGGCCVECHFATEEREILHRLPDEVQEWISRDHAKLREIKAKTGAWPTDLIIEHAQREDRAFAQHLPSALAQEMVKEHEKVKHKLQTKAANESRKSSRLYRLLS